MHPWRATAGGGGVDYSDEPEIPDRAKEYFGPYIPTSELTPADVPAADGPLDPIISFAYTMNGYWVTGSFRRCAEIAMAPDWDSVEELRIAMFFDLRAAHHAGDGIEGAILRRLVGRVGELVGAQSAQDAPRDIP